MRDRGWGRRSLRDGGRGGGEREKFVAENRRARAGAGKPLRIDSEYSQWQSRKNYFSAICLPVPFFFKELSSR